MRFFILSLISIAFMGCYSSPSDDFLDTNPKTNNTSYLPQSQGGQGAPQMPPMPGMGGAGMGDE